MLMFIMVLAHKILILTPGVLQSFALLQAQEKDLRVTLTF